MKRILVIEDNEADMYLTRFIFKKCGYEVIEATSGEEGVELAIKERPDLIIMDEKLPGIDGLETAKRIRKSKAEDKFPIIALTAYAMAGDRERALKAGCTGYITKPIDPETFMDELKKYL